MERQKPEPPDSRRLSRDELNFLRGDANERVKKDDGTAEIEAVAGSPEVIALLEKADAIERWRLTQCIWAQGLLDDLGSIEPLDTAVGPMFVSNILEIKKELVKFVRATNINGIHARVENLAIATVRNRGVPFLKNLQDDVNAFDYMVSLIPKKAEELNVEIRGYIERKKRLPSGAKYVGNEAKQGQAPEPSDEIVVVSNADHSVGAFSSSHRFKS
jgi:hypothetical protein